jgi:hypothetical protein
MSHSSTPRYDPQVALGIAQGFIPKDTEPEHSLEWYARETAKSSARPPEW